MKKRILAAVLAFCMIFTMLPLSAQAADTMARVDVTDTAVSLGRTVYDINGNATTFSYTVPQDGVTMLVFFSTGCYYSQTLFQRLNRVEWINNPYINIVAVETNKASTDTLSDFISTHAPNTRDSITYYCTKNNTILWDYWALISNTAGTTWPVVCLISNSGDTNTIVYGDKQMTDVNTIYASMCQMSSALKDYTYPVDPENGMVEVMTSGVLRYPTVTEIVDLVNEARAENGLAPLSLDADLTQAAMMRAIECGLFYSHTRPSGDTFSTVFEDIYYGSSAENIAYGYTSAEAVMNGWMNSEGHRANILRENMTHIGIGAARMDGVTYWVQLFHDNVPDSLGYVKNYNSIFTATIESIPDQFKAEKDEIRINLDPSGSGSQTTIAMKYFYGRNEIACSLFPASVSLDNPKVNIPVQDASGNTIATLCPAMDGTANMTVQAVSEGTGTLAMPIYEGQSNPVKLIVTVGSASTDNGNSNDNDNNSTNVPISNDVSRIFGENRFQTAFAVADELKKNLGVSKFDAIIVASGGDFADALSGSYLSSVLNAPILLGYKKGDYNAQTAAYIQENLADNGVVYILGGYNAIPESMESLLRGMRVKRLAGTNRFETNLLVLLEAGVPTGDEILVATGTDFADCLSGSATGRPILLVYKKLMDSQKAYLSTLNNSFCIIGGENAVSKTLENQIESYGPVSRLAGKNRLETSVLVAQRYFADPDSAVIAYGWNYPDGLCGGALANSIGAPLILTHSNAKYYATAANYTASQGIRTGYVLGGSGLITDDAAGAIFSVD